MNEFLDESQIVLALARDTAQRITDETIAALKKMTDTLSGDDTGLKTTWEEICVQVQFQESYGWELYDGVVRSLVFFLLKETPSYAIAAVWRLTDAGTSISGQTETEYSSDINEDVVNYLVQECIYSEAGNYSNRRIQAYLNEENEDEEDEEWEEEDELEDEEDDQDDETE